ncbi:Peptidase family M13 [compost metagenome]
MLSTSALLVSQPTRRPAVLNKCTFNSNSAKFDGIGYRVNWWTKEDYKKFEAKAKAVVDQYSKLEYLCQKINGQRTLPNPPVKFRINVVVANTNDFYSTFGVKKGGCYVHCP